MKIRVQFKTPDAVDDALKSAFAHEEGDPESDEAYQKWCDAEELCKRFVKYGEYITVEFDTESGTVTVVPVNQ